MKTRKPLFRKPDPFETEIQAQRIRVSTRIKRDGEPVLDYIRARDSLKQINIQGGNNGAKEV